MPPFFWYIFMKGGIMKKVFILSVLLLSISLYGGTNLIYNGGFEIWNDTSTPDQWFFESGVTFTKDSTTVYEGSYSAKVTLLTQTQSNTDTYPFDTIAVTPGNTYTYSIMVYDNDAAGSVRWIIDFFDGSKVLDSTHWGGYSSDIDGWQEISYTFTVPSDVYYVLPRIRFYDNSTAWDGDAIFYIDYVDLEDTSSSTGNTPPSISNVSRNPAVVQEGDTVIISADITDNSSIIADTLFYSVNGGSYLSIQKDSVSLSTYYYHIGSFLLNDTVNYYIKAVDDSSAVSVSDTYSFVVTDIPDIKINEVGYDVDGVDPYAEWIELYNPEDYDADISGWIITDYPSPDGGTEGSIELPAGTVIPSHGYFVVMCDADSFFTYYSLPTGVGCYAHNDVSLSLSNTGDDIHLYNADSMEIDVVWYEGGGNIGSDGAAEGVGTGGSIGRSPDGYDTDDCSVDFYPYDNSDITPGSRNLNRAPKILSYERDEIVPLSGNGAEVLANVIDDYGISSVYLRYYVDGAVDSVLMALSKNEYVGTIPPQSDGSLVEYEIIAYDDSSLYTVSDNKQGYFSGITPISKVDVNDSDGFPLYYGYGARVTGVVTVPSGVFNTYNTIINVQERGTTDALVAKVDTFISGIDEGDSVIVEGTIGISTGQLRITDPGANISVVQSDVGLIDPIELTAADLKDTVGEQWDGTFVYIWADTLTPSSNPWPSAGSSAALWVYDSTAVDSYKIWIDNDTDIDDNSEPSWHFYVAGVVSQYDTYSPYFEGYEIMPRYYVDFGYDLAFENISFTGYSNGNGVILSWSVKNGDFVRFDIYRSYDRSDDYEKVGSVSSSISSKYEYKDNVSLDRTLYYKIGAVKNNGSTIYFGPVKISSIIGTSSFRLYMPAFVRKDAIVLRIYSPADGVGMLNITDKTGRVVYKKELNISDGINYISINPQLIRGLYIIKLEFKGKDYTRKIIVN